MIHVIAIIRCKPGRRQEVIDIFNANVPAVLAEAGCIAYEAAVDAAGSSRPLGPDTFVAVEK
jgi:quinol monooxygenase YgiN